MRPPFGRLWLREFLLDPDATYLNHGTVGVTPRRVLDVQRGVMDEIERHPSRFLLRELTGITFGGPPSAEPRIRQAAEVVAQFVGGRGDDLVFVDNATTGVNAVLRSWPFERGDEILLSELGYGGVACAAAYAARERGATVRTLAMPASLTPEAIVQAWAEGVAPETRLAIVDHITADSALVLPVAAIVDVLHTRGVAVVVDGAHAPGAIGLDVPALGADYYVANLHKWGWTPRASGFLWAPLSRQRGLHPPVISWGLDQGFTAEFDMLGTRDPSPHLSAPAAIALFEEWGGAAAIQARNHALALDGARHLAERWGTELTTPASMIGTMATVTLPEAAGTDRDAATALRFRLLEEDGIEAHVHAFRDRVRVRISAQIYNDMDDMERLAAAVLRHIR